MKDNAVILTDEDLDTTYALVEEFFGSMRADQVYFNLTHQQY